MRRAKRNAAKLLSAAKMLLPSSTKSFTLIFLSVTGQKTRLCFLYTLSQAIYRGR